MLQKVFPFPIQAVQTDNGTEFTYQHISETSVEDLNRKLSRHLAWSNRKPMRTLGNKSPLELLHEKLAAA